MRKDHPNSPLPDSKNVYSLVARPRCQAAGPFLAKIYMSAQIVAPCGYFFTICGGSIKTHRPALSFRHLAERRA